MRHWFNLHLPTWSKHVKRQRIMSELHEWWPDFIMKRSRALSLMCSQSCCCYLLSKDVLISVFCWMNKLNSCCFSMWVLWVVICMTEQKCHRWMDASRLWWQCQQPVHAHNVLTHTHTSQMRQWVITSPCIGWLTLIFDQGCIIQMQSQIHIKYNPAKGHIVNIKS